MVVLSSKHASKHISLIVLLSLSLILCDGVNAQSSDKTSSKACDRNTRKRVDELLAKVTTYGNSGRKFPENNDQLPKYCNDSKALVENIEGLNKKCLEGLSKRVLTVSIFTVKSVIRQLCRKSNKLLPEYFEAAKCINSAHNPVGKCFTRSIDQLLGMQFADEKQKIPMACCEVPRLRSCMEESQKDIDFCTEKNIEATNRFIDSIIGNSVNLLGCGEYLDSSDKCGKLVVPKKKKSQKRPKSLIMAFLALIESFPEVEQEK